jgi:hypothetical protein
MFLSGTRLTARLKELRPVTDFSKLFYNQGASDKLFRIAWQSAGRLKRSVAVSNRVLTLTGTSLRFFTRPTLVFYLIYWSSG